MFEELEAVIESAYGSSGFDKDDIAQESLFTKTDSQKVAAMKKRYAVALSKAESKLRKKLKTTQECIAYKKALSAEAAKYNQALQKLANAYKKEMSGKYTTEQIKSEIGPYLSFLKTNSETLFIKVLGGGTRLTNTSEDIKALGQYIKDLRKIADKIMNELKGGRATESATDCNDECDCKKKGKSKSEDDDTDEPDDDDTDDEDTKKKSKKKDDEDDEDIADECASFIAVCESMMIDTTEYELQDLFDDLDVVAQEAGIYSDDSLESLFNELDTIVQESNLSQYEDDPIAYLDNLFNFNDI